MTKTKVYVSYTDYYYYYFIQLCIKFQNSMIRSTNVTSATPPQADRTCLPLSFYSIPDSTTSSSLTLHAVSQDFDVEKEACDYLDVLRACNRVPSSSEDCYSVTVGPTHIGEQQYCDLEMLTEEELGEFLACGGEVKENAGNNMLLEEMDICTPEIFIPQDAGK